MKNHTCLPRIDRIKCQFKTEIEARLFCMWISDKGIPFKEPLFFKIFYTVGNPVWVYITTEVYANGDRYESTLAEKLLGIPSEVSVKDFKQILIDTITKEKYLNWTNLYGHKIYPSIHTKKNSY